MLVTTASQLETLHRECELASEVSYDTEAKVAKRGTGAKAGLDLYDAGNYICGFSVKPRGSEARYVSLRHPDSTNFPRALATLWPVIRNKTLGHNSLGFDAIMGYVHHGLPLPTK